MDKIKRIAMVAHDGRKKDMVDWVGYNEESLKKHILFASGTTGGLLMSTFPSLDITALKSGPLGGDQQVGALIAEGRLDMLIFLMDPMSPHPHDVDIKALLRLAVLYNIPAAYNRTTADFIISSPLFDRVYKPVQKDYSGYLKRKVDGEDEKE